MTRTADEKAEVMWRIGATTGHAVGVDDRLAELINGETTPESPKVTDCLMDGRLCSHQPGEPCDPYSLIREGEARRLGWLFHAKGGASHG